MNSPLFVGKLVLLTCTQRGECGSAGREGDREDGSKYVDLISLE